jgi:hypothetical protein
MADPNADLIGFMFTNDSGRTCEVFASASWGSTYVLVDCAGTTTTRSAALVRRAKELRHG